MPKSAAKMRKLRQITDTEDTELYQKGNENESKRKKMIRDQKGEKRKIDDVKLMEYRAYKKIWKTGERKRQKEEEKRCATKEEERQKENGERDKTAK